MILDDEKQKNLLLQIIDNTPLQGTFKDFLQIANTPLAQLRKVVEEATITEERLQ